MPTVVSSLRVASSQSVVPLPSNPLSWSLALLPSLGLLKYRACQRHQAYCRCRGWHHRRAYCCCRIWRHSQVWRPSQQVLSGVKWHGVVANWCGIVTKLGVDVTKRAPNGVATSPRIASLPEHSVLVAVIAEHAPSSVGWQRTAWGCCQVAWYHHQVVGCQRLSVALSSPSVCQTEWRRC